MGEEKNDREEETMPLLLSSKTTPHTETEQENTNVKNFQATSGAGSKKVEIISSAENDIRENAPDNTQATSSSKNGDVEQETRRVKIEFVANAALADTIERAKHLLRHKFPRARLEEIFNQALEDMLEKRDPARKIARQKKGRGVLELDHKFHGALVETQQ